MLTSFLNGIAAPFEFLFYKLWVWLFYAIAATFSALPWIVGFLIGCALVCLCAMLAFNCYLALMDRPYFASKREIRRLGYAVRELSSLALTNRVEMPGSLRLAGDHLRRAGDSILFGAYDIALDEARKGIKEATSAAYTFQNETVGSDYWRTEAVLASLGALD